MILFWQKIGHLDFISFRTFFDLTVKGLIIDSIPGETLEYAANEDISLTGITVGGLDVRDLDINYAIVPRNILSAASTIPSECLNEDGTFTSIKLPSNNILNISKRQSEEKIPNNQRIFGVYYYLWDNLTIPMKNSSNKAISPIISLYVQESSQLSNENVSNLSQPITFCHLIDKKKNEANYSCGYSSGGSEWETKGCTLKNIAKLDDTTRVVVCECNHLTDFSVLESFENIISSSNSEYFTEEPTHFWFNATILLPLLFLFFFVSLAGCYLHKLDKLDKNEWEKNKEK